MAGGNHFFNQEKSWHYFGGYCRQSEWQFENDLRAYKKTNKRRFSEKEIPRLVRGTHSLALWRKDGRGLEKILDLVSLETLLFPFGDSHFRWFNNAVGEHPTGFEFGNDVV